MGSFNAIRAKKNTKMYVGPNAIIVTTVSQVCLLSPFLIFKDSRFLIGELQTRNDNN